jgi:diguanylate cyclase (GGDEF)-like protein
MTTEVQGAARETSRPVGVRRWWPRGSTATDDRPVHHEMTPHRQVQLLWLVTTFLVVAVAVVTPLALRGAQNGLNTATQRLVPASTELTNTIGNYTAGSAELLVVVQAPNDATRADGISELTTVNSAADTAWRTYKRVAANLPGETKLQTRVTLDTQQLAAAGLALLTTPTNSPAAMAAFTAVGDRQHRDLDQIQRLYQARINASVTSADHQFNTSQAALLIVLTMALVLIMIGFHIRTHRVRRRERIQVEGNRIANLESGLQRALEMAHSEQASYTLMQHAIQLSSPSLPSEFLVADSSRAHFRQVITTGADGGPGCPVMSPYECPATDRGQTQTWPTSSAIDTCPYLRDRETGACSAVCVPVSIAGQTIGVVHATGPDHHPPVPSTAADLELIAGKTGERIGILRAFNKSENQARTDPLTGLLNRRSLETAVRDLTADAHPYAVAYGDLDHFKLLNDVHGHDTGDRALRLFARVLRDSVRPNDIAARYGGEEFVVVLPDCTITDAYAVVDRVRARLADAQQGGTVPTFTVSFGLAPAEPNLTFGEIVEQADAALLQAKSEGRDRVVVAGQHDQTSDPGSAPKLAPELHATT